MTDLKQLIENTDGISDYKINEKRTLSTELFFVGRKLETARNTDVSDVSVTVYVDHDGARGESAFAVLKSMSEKEISEKLRAAVKRANLVFNKPYEIPSGGKEEYAADSSMKNYDGEELAEKIAEAVFSADTYENGSLNATEIFVYDETVKVRNGKGVDKTSNSVRAMIETIPTWTTEKISVELYEALNFTEFSAEEITEEINSKMKEVRDRRTAVKPSAGVIDVVLRPKETEELMETLLYGLSYGAVYSHSNVFKKGDKVQKEIKGDPLTVTVKAKIKGSRYSADFDEDGFTLKDKKIIDRGEVVGYYGSYRFGQYLGENESDVTGNVKCIEVDGGSLDEKKDLNRYLECVSLSGIQVDEYNDYIGGEIRLAYLHEGEKVTPVTGISMSGSLSAALGKIRLSAERTAREKYFGPTKVLLPDMNIV